MDKHVASMPMKILFTHLVFFHLMFWAVSYTVEKDLAKYEKVARKYNTYAMSFYYYSVFMTFIGGLMEVQTKLQTALG